MVEQSILKKYDISGMYKIYEQWPEISEEAYSSNLKQVEFDTIDHIIFVGMGGSGAIGDVFGSILSKAKIHVSVVKGYVLPSTVDSKSLVIVISISGNTIETLSVLESAKIIGCKIIAISSGGKIEKFCKKHKIEFTKITQIHSPRVSFVKFFYSLLKILEPIIPITIEEINESILIMKNLRNQISVNNLSKTNSALKLAEWIEEIPLIYYPYGLNATAIRFKNALQENSKNHAIIEDIIEASHNGIVSWEKPSGIQPILLQGQDDHIKTKERWKIIKEYFKENEIDYFEVFSTEGNILTKIINLIYFFDYVSIYKAILSKTDPTPVKSIEYIKRKLNDLDSKKNNF